MSEYVGLVPQWLFIDIETMTLNSHFALNTVSDTGVARGGP